MSKPLPPPSGLPADVLAFVFDALALVGLRRADPAEVRRHLPHQVPIRPADREPGRVLDLDRDARRRIEDHRVGESHLERKLLAVHLRAVPGADDLEHLAETVRHSQHHVRDVRAHRAERGIARRPLRRDLRRGARDRDRRAREHVRREVALGPLHPHPAARDLDRDSGRDRNRLPSHSRHSSSYQIWQTSSPPSPASRASRSVISPREVETIDVPSPPRTRGSVSRRTYRRRPGVLMRRIPVITLWSSALYLRYRRSTPCLVSSITLKLLM